MQKPPHETGGFFRVVQTHRHSTGSRVAGPTCRTLLTMRHYFLTTMSFLTDFTPLMLRVIVMAFCTWSGELTKPLS